MSTQRLNVNDDANDRTALEKKVQQRVGRKVTMDEKEATISEFDSLSSNVVPAILVKEQGGGGAVYIHAESADLVDMLQTGPDRQPNFWLMFLESGENFRFYGRPSVRYFRFSG